MSAHCDRCSHLNFLMLQVVVDRIVTNAVNIAAWYTKDILARGYLIATIQSQQQRSLINCKTANQMWVRLSAQYLRNAVERKRSYMATRWSTGDQIPKIPHFFPIIIQLTIPTDQHSYHKAVVKVNEY